MASKPKQKAIYSLESEQAVLGSLLLKNDCFDEITGLLQAEDFYPWGHQCIFKAIATLLSKGQSADLITVEQELKKIEYAKDNDGTFAYIAEIAHTTPSVANIKAHADIILGYSRQRRLNSLGQYLVERTQSHCSATNFEQILTESEKTLFDIAINQIQDNQPVDLSQVMDKVVNRIESACKTKDPIVGTPSGFKKLDFKTGGFQPGMHILAARPSMGKTACALTLAYNALEMRPAPVHMYSLEMPADQIMQRMISLVSNLSADRIRSPLSMGEEDYGKLALALGHIKKWTNRFILDDESRLTPHKLRTKIRRNIRLFGKPSIILVDYLQIMTMPGKPNRYEEVTAISAEIKAISKEVDVPIIALSQLSRNPENRVDKRPILSDLRESGAIEQDADFIMFLHRDDYYAKTDDELNGLCEIIIAKNRNGPLGRVLCKFEGEYSRFTELNDTEHRSTY